jgi:hypothetical protein
MSKKWAFLSEKMFFWREKELCELEKGVLERNRAPHRAAAGTATISATSLSQSESPSAGPRLAESVLFCPSRSHFFSLYGSF